MDRNKSLVIFATIIVAVILIVCTVIVMVMHHGSDSITEMPTNLDKTANPVVKISPKFSKTFATTPSKPFQWRFNCNSSFYINSANLYFSYNN